MPGNVFCCLSILVRYFLSYGKSLILKAHSQVEDLMIESPLKVMKNAFYFIPKALFVLKIIKLLS